MPNDDDKVTIFIGNIIHCIAGYELHVLEKGYVIVEGQKILDIGEESSLEIRKFNLGLRDDVINTIYLKSSQILIPGLVDTHIHAPQYPNIGLGYDKPLLDWLDTYTYPLEKKYSDLEFSEKVYNAVVKNTLQHGTTTACYFGSLYENSTMVLVDAVIKNGQRALVGKINMITLAPDDYVETHEESITSTKKFIEEMESRKNNLVKAVITPRFAPSVDMELMKDLAVIAKEKDLHIQSHISENLAEIEMVQERYGMSYAEVYEQAGLLTDKTVLAHGVHLSNDEMSLLAQKGTSIAHCADSNTCLKSGMCDVRKLQSYGIKIGLGTDVSGGSSSSIVRAMKSTLDNSIHLSAVKENYTPLNYKDVFYMATLGGAEALALDEQIGNFVPGKDFDALIIEMDVENGGSDYFITCDALELLQKFIYLGDDRNVLKVYVAGRSVK